LAGKLLEEFIAGPEGRYSRQLQSGRVYGGRKLKTAPLPDGRNVAVAGYLA
jgi:hypothetical protein